MVEKALQNSKIFLHSMQNEPFGISTVEALNAGCIPVTHDSGGQQEIVLDSRFRYTSQSECVDIINLVSNNEYTLNVDEISEQLESYTDSHFRKMLQESVNNEQ
jgi:glycosyltransferase involved in cell wall biosynthesis